MKVKEIRQKYLEAKMLELKNPALSKQILIEVTDKAIREGFYAAKREETAMCQYVDIPELKNAWQSGVNCFLELYATAA